MIIKKTSWHYKTWALTYRMWGMAPPDSTSLCPYVRNIMLLLPGSLLWLGIALLFGLAYLFTLVLQTLGNFIIGFRPSGWDMSSQPYRGLRINHMEIYPWHVILFLLPLWILPKFANLSLWLTALIVCGMVVALFGAVKLWHSDALSIFKLWLKAKKEGVCPILDFEEK
jgi:hypothetical protein